MALGVQMEQAGFEPESLNTQAAVQLEKQGEGFAITSIHLTLKGKVPKITGDKFNELANGAKENCPISQLLDTKITMDAELLS